MSGAEVAQADSPLIKVLPPRPPSRDDGAITAMPAMNLSVPSPDMSRAPGGSNRNSLRSAAFSSSESMLLSPDTYTEKPVPSSPESTYSRISNDTQKRAVERRLSDRHHSPVGALASCYFANLC